MTRGSGVVQTRGIASSGRTTPWVVAAVVTAVVAAGCGGSDAPRSAPAQPSTTVPRPTTTTAPSLPANLTPTTAPPGFASPAATWLRATRPDGTAQLLAVFRPPRASGRTPVVVALHGSSGLPRLLIDWAPQLAATGITVVVGCYLDAPTTAARASPSPFLACPGLPDSTRATTPQLFDRVETLVDAATGLPGIDRERVGMVGISLGAMVAVSLDDTRVRAIAADSGYRMTPGATRVPVLLLGMATDPNVEHTKVVRYESNQAGAGQPVAAHYYPGTGHVTIFGPPPVADDATSRITAFFAAQLGAGHPGV